MHLMFRSQFYNGQRVKLIDSIHCIISGVIRIHNGLVYFCSNNSFYNGLPLLDKLKFGMKYSIVLSFSRSDALLGKPILSEE